MTLSVETVLVSLTAATLAVALLTHLWLVGRAAAGQPDADRRARWWSGGSVVLMAGAVVATALLRAEPGAASVLAGLVPVLGLPALFPAPPAERWRLSAPIVASAMAAASGVALSLVAAAQLAAPDPALARVALALLVIQVGLIGAVVPGHLWSLGLANQASTLGLAATVGLGGLGAVAALSASLERDEWLLGIVGARPLLAAVGAIGLGLGAIGLLGELRPVRAVLLLGQLAGAAAWLCLASGAVDGPDAAILLLLTRSVGLSAALLALDALERLPPLSWRAPHRRRLLGPAQVALWIGVGSLIGLPPTAGPLAAWNALEVVRPDRPEVAIALLGAVAVGLVGARRIALALLVAPVERPAAAEPTGSAVRLTAVPLALGAGLLAIGLAGGPLLAALGVAVGRLGGA